jgi:hypothetical protein
MAQAPLDVAEPVTRPIGARLVLSQAAALEALAEERGQTVSQLVREVVTRELAGARSPPAD